MPNHVLKKAQIHTQIFYNFNVLRLQTIQESLRWITQMTQAINKRTESLKLSTRDFESRIKASLIEFNQLKSVSSKNSNLTVQQIWQQQLRAVSRLGVDDITAISTVFKTPYIIRKAYLKCLDDEMLAVNILNAGKLLLLTDRSLSTK